MNEVKDIKDNIKRIRQRIEQAALRSGRNPAEVELVAVTKNVPVERIELALKEGITIVGENRVQEALKKQPFLPDNVKWHLIGHLQRNKVKKVIGKFDLIHSLDSYPLALEINKQAIKLGQTVDVLIQVNVAGEESKFGISPEKLTDFILQLAELPALKIKGLMTIAPYTQNPETVRPVFRKLRELREEIAAQGIPIEYLSMGMTNDFEVAIEEGANLVRIGTGIFGERI
ncbi:MAG TPA: YggS family pyridoxal phosphate-dependent enzyme [Clostridia bacterium]|nr:YggS family pyridoxal phosphate-dependent enzyme [Clostridia bacterium]